MKKYISFFGLFISVCIFSSCSNDLNNDSGSGSPVGGKKGRYSLLTVPTLSDTTYGSFYLMRSSGRYSNAEYADTNISNFNDYSVSASNYSAAYFGSMQPVDTPKVNSLLYSASNNSAQVHYVHFNPSILLNGSNNVFQWTKSGTTYTENVPANMPMISITSPAFMDTINKSSGLTIVWPPSGNTGDYVQITLQGQPNIPVGGVGDSSYTISSYSAYADDNGTYVIPGYVLTPFYESKARLTLSRGVVQESVHGGKSYLFVVATSRAIDIKLQ